MCLGASRGQVYGSVGGGLGSWPKKPNGGKVDSRHGQHVFVVGDTFNSSMARMDLEGD